MFHFLHNYFALQLSFYYINHKITKGVCELEVSPQFGPKNHARKIDKIHNDFEL